MEPLDDHFRESLGVPPYLSTPESFVRGEFKSTGADIIATSHSTYPIAQDYLTEDGSRKILINNGCAGAPNLSGPLSGLLTRISVFEPSEKVLCGVKVNDVHVHLQRVDYPKDDFVQHFCSNWSPNSPGALLFSVRLFTGTNLSPRQVARGSFKANVTIEDENIPTSIFNTKA
eukprot:TRINITY_DN14014_c0_g1_i1.p2 TRINITY_DN14014_c0_g1~~TRINITY_DN14014_c0_g1_i1.p2  ORF type:complete len:173 (-),score=30.06 TRINITY_DN14014_c0_g1_i1:74-592(-)